MWGGVGFDEWEMGDDWCVRGECGGGVWEN